MDLGEKVDKGARIVWYGAIGLGFVIAVIGFLWLLDTLEIININMWTIIALIVFFIGVSIIVFGMWLRSLIKS